MPCSAGFDPRVVTLLFYALVIALAARFPVSVEGRLCAAGIAALNPLVYWHQIFGANDLVFVAMVLGAVLLAREPRPVASGLVLGLACATKQLAWPFAPFLLVALCGARSFRDLAGAAAWRRLLGPAAAAAAVFVAVVVPVAALDFRAFWGDIVVYNVGLPGGDNYPFGGTPGFGFANFLLYFGRVADLRDYFPFSVFYALLVPLGFLLLRAQLRDGHPEWALATGSTALVASLYFSRVVHPNYLIPAAVVLPLAVLARRRGADVALAPLLLLALAVEMAEGAIFRTAWEQAAAADLPARLGGLVAALAPRAGPSLTKDPLGLLFSATAAGFGVLYLALAVCGAPRRLRLGVTAVAAALAIGVPALVLAGIGSRTGVVRAQDPAVVQAEADGGRLLALRSPYTLPHETSPRGRQAVSESFRLDPPAEILPSQPLLPPGPSVLAGLSRAIGVRDLRLVTVLALGVLAAVAAVGFEGRRRRAALALALLVAPLALGTVLGSPVALSLAALVGAWAAGRRGVALGAGLLAGAAVALDHRAALVVPFLVLAPGNRGAVRRGAHRRRPRVPPGGRSRGVPRPWRLLLPTGGAGRPRPRPRAVLAIDKILAGESPYGADYSGTILARQARVSSFWDELGGNPILRHHAYLPGTHLVMLPFHLAGRALFGGLRPARRHPPLLRAGHRPRRPLPGLGRGAALRGGDRGAQPARLLAPDLRRERPRVRGHDPGRGAPRPGAEAGRLAASLLGLACATKQLAWPFAPFLLVALCGARSFRDLAGAAAWRRLARARGGGGGGLRGRRRPRRGPGLPRVLGRHRGLQRRAARRRQLPVRGNARVRLRELPPLLRPGGRACGTTSRSRSSTRCSCRWASCSCARSFGTGTRSGPWPRGAPRSSPRSTSRASSTRTT